MIRKLTYKILSVTIAVVFFLITTGFNLYVHWCDCENIVKTSIVSVPGCGDTHDSCSIHSCDNKTLEYHDQSCGCKSDVIKIKLEDTNYFSSYLNVEFRYLPTIIQIIANINFTLEDDSSSIVNCYNPDESPPILPSGKAIIIQYHQFKTPEFIA